MFDQHANKVVTFEAAHLAAEAHENSRNSGEFRHKAGHAIATAERLQSSVSGPPENWSTANVVVASRGRAEWGDLGAATAVSPHCFRNCS